ncbi:MAG: hypothetical protein M0P39_06640 [Rhodocyclaceae bacterium]|jgi:hypothetical protein|nr:hypothetical protein [Rhodocyclaceae bacterium]
MTAVGKKPCVNCTCAATGFCPRGVGVHIKREAPVAARPLTAAQRAQALREQLQKLPGKRRSLRY